MIRRPGFELGQYLATDTIPLANFFLATLIIINEHNFSCRLTYFIDKWRQRRHPKRFPKYRVYILLLMLQAYILLTNSME
jgi:hypothetical protein